jgi:GABA permease
VYLLIAVSELRSRLECEAPERLQLKMWLYPYLTILTIVLFVALIASMGIIADTRIQLALGLLNAGLVLLAYFVFHRSRSGGGRGANRERPRGIGGALKERDLGAGSSRRARPLMQ